MKYSKKGKRQIFFISAGHIPPEESAYNAVAAWANACERKLLNLHVGQTLERSRHHQWAKRIAGEITIVNEQRGYEYPRVTGWVSI